MGDESKQPEIIRPSAEAPPTAGGHHGSVFVARPALPARISLARVYPELEMGRGSALVDAVVAVCLFVAMFISPQVGDLMVFVAEQFPEYGMLWSNVIIGSASVCIVAVILMCRRQGPSSIGLGRFQLNTLVATLFAVPACYAVTFMTGILYFAYKLLFGGLDIDSVLAEKQGLIDVIPQFSIATVLLFGVLTGFHEELLFRGLLLTRFNGILRSKKLAVILSAVLFGLVHAYQGPMGIVQTGAIGLVLGTITTISRSLWPAIIGHAAFNSIQLALIPILKPFLEGMQQAPASMPA